MQLVVGEEKLVIHIPQRPFCIFHRSVSRWGRCGKVAGDVALHSMYHFLLFIKFFPHPAKCGKDDGPACSYFVLK